MTDTPKEPQDSAVGTQDQGDPEWLVLADALPMVASYMEWDGESLRYRFANRNYEKWFRVKREDLVGRPLREILGERTYLFVEDYLKRALAGERITYEVRVPYKSATVRHVRVEYVPRMSGDRVQGIYSLIEDVTQARELEAELRESAEDYRHAAALNPQVAWTASPEGEVERIAPRWREWTGSSGLGADFAGTLHPKDVERTFTSWDRSVKSGEPYDVMHRVRRLDGEYRWIRSRAFPRRDEAGAILRWYGATEDIHEQKTAEDRLRLLVLELNHRVKNNLATVQAIAMQTLRGTAETDAARHKMIDRIAALASAHDILTREQWEGAGIAEVAHGVLEALAGAAGRITINGPALRLASQIALSLAMAFHELGTNALKYGALSNQSGTVDLTWAVTPSGKVAVTWLERGGPKVTAPTRQGFGTRLLERGVAHELKADVRLDFQPEGLRCTITAHLPEPAQGDGSGRLGSAWASRA